jgi:hypothetical protein
MEIVSIEANRCQKENSPNSTLFFDIFWGIYGVVQRWQVEHYAVLMLQYKKVPHMERVPLSSDFFNT